MTQLQQLSVSLAAGPGVTQWFTFDASALDGTKSMVEIIATNSTGGIVATNYEAYATPEVSARVCFKVSVRVCVRC